MLRGPTWIAGALLVAVLLALARRASGPGWAGVAQVAFEVRAGWTTSLTIVTVAGVYLP